MGQDRRPASNFDRVRLWISAERSADCPDRFQQSIVSRQVSTRSDYPDVEEFSPR